MTWDELKAAVDAALAAEGRTGDVEVFYLDTGNYPTAERLNVWVDGEDGLVVDG